MDAYDTWLWTQNETMHPFWAVRRLTHKQLSAEAHRAHVDGKMQPRFNCAIKKHMMSCVAVGAVGTEHLNTTRTCQISFLTNSVDVKEGEELVLEVADKKGVETKPKRTWRDAFREEERNATIRQERLDAAKRKTT